jgi:ubiquinone biosynthesis protein
MSRAARVLEIARVAGRYRLDDLLPENTGHPLLLAALRANPWRLTAAPAGRGERLRRALEDLGPVFVKFGQMLSTRRDLLPPDIADELARLQDQVPAFDPRIAMDIIEAELGAPVDTLFERFDREPMASASVAQVHGARLREGREVVVKVIRPEIDATIRKDIALLRLIAGLVERYLPDGRRLRPVEVVDDYRHTILDELDLGREAANASQLRRNFEGSDLVYVPEVCWEYTRHRVMVMERIRGIPVTDLDALRERDVDLKLLGERGVEIFFTQVFRDSFFHADMHPGNIFVDATDPADPRYIAIDCAIIGSLSESTSTTWRATSWASSAATITRWRSCTSSAAGYRQIRGCRTSRRRCAPSANPCSSVRSRRYPSASCSSTCSAPRRALTCRYNPPWCCCRRRS